MGEGGSAVRAINIDNSTPPMSIRLKCFSFALLFSYLADYFVTKLSPSPWMLAFWKEEGPFCSWKTYTTNTSIWAQSDTFTFGFRDWRQSQEKGSVFSVSKSWLLLPISHHFRSDKLYRLSGTDCIGIRCHSPPKDGEREEGRWKSEFNNFERILCNCVCNHLKILPHCSLMEIWLHIRSAE